MRKSTAFWMAVACFCWGVLWGFLFAPIKKGITIYACNNGNGSFNGLETEEEGFVDSDLLENLEEL